MPSLPMAVLAATAVNSLYSLVPRGHVRQVGKWIVAGILTLVAFSRVYLGQDALSDVLAGLVIGVAVPLAAFRLFAPGDVFPVTYGHRRSAHVDVTGVRHDAIVQAMSDQLGVVAEEIKPFGLEGSGGSTPLRVKVKSDPDTYLFCKLYAATHLRSDRWYKLGRTLLYGRLEDEKPFNTVRRLVQYEDYALRVLYAAGLPVPKSCGIVEITPEREYILAMEFADGSKEIGEVDVDESLMDQGMVIVRRLWEAGLAHRDIKPANLLVRDGRLLLIDSAFTEIRPSPWRQAVDLANMMLVLALRSTPERVLARAQVFFSDEEIAEAFAATRGLTMPSQLRKLMRAQGRDLHAEFLRLLPVRLPPIAIQNWTWRRVALLIFVLLAGIFAVMITIPLLSSPL
jgi:tRNA A-37 threonylcarbamoyl transferase component Bud32